MLPLISLRHPSNTNSLSSLKLSCLPTFVSTRFKCHLWQCLGYNISNLPSAWDIFEHHLSLADLFLWQSAHLSQFALSIYRILLDHLLELWHLDCDAIWLVFIPIVYLNLLAMTVFILILLLCWVELCIFSLYAWLGDCLLILSTLWHQITNQIDMYPHHAESIILYQLPN